MNSKEKDDQKKEGRVDPVDAIIAQRLLRRRCLLGYSQRDLADYAGVSIQQIQKYEKSTNRISGGRLYKFSKLLRVPIEYFFESIDEILAKKGGYVSALAEEQIAFTPKVQEGIATEKEVITLVKSYNGIKDKNVRRRFLELLRSVSGIAGYV